MSSGAAITVGEWRSGGSRQVPWLAAGALLLALGLVGFLIHPILGAAVLGIFVAPIFVTAPRYALLLFAALLPFDGVSSVGDGGITLTRLLGLALFAGWILHVLITRERVQLTRAGWGLVAFGLFAALSVAWAPDPASSGRAVLKLAQLLMLTVMGAHVLREPRDVQRMLDVVLASTVVVALLMLTTGHIDGERMSFTFGSGNVNPNHVAATLVFPAVAAIALAPTSGMLGRWRLAAVAPIVVALFLTGSRGGAVSLVAGLLFVSALRRRVGIRLAVGAVVLAIAVPMVASQATVDRLLSRFSAAQQDRLSGRTDIWKVAIAMIEDRPLQGQSYGGFDEAFYHYMLTANVDPVFGRLHSRGNRAAHNIYLGTLAELGVVGFLLLLAALAVQARALWRARIAALRRGDEATAQLALALMGVFTSMALFGATLDLLTAKATWVWFALMQATTCFGLPEWARRRI